MRGCVGLFVGVSPAVGRVCVESECTNGPWSTCRLFLFGLVLFSLVGSLLVVGVGVSFSSSIGGMKSSCECCGWMNLRFSV